MQIQINIGIVKIMVLLAVVVIVSAGTIITVTRARYPVIDSPREVAVELKRSEKVP
jgi:hypothetical protein